VRSCVVCNEQNPDRASFCLACGAALDAVTAEDHETRRIVTVVFCDVVGSTPLGERLDPEALRGVLTRFAAEIERVAERHGGHAGDLMGDGLMCVFGVPAAHEDDALRAVRSAAEMAAAVERLNTRLRAELDVVLAVRIGVNTGEVVASGRSPVLGDAINVAARLEQAGAPGEILIGDATYLLVRDAVEVERVAPVAAKGKDQRVPAWRLVRVLAGASGFARRLDAPLLERERELDSILQAFERAAGDRTCHLVTVLGDAGIGKSRLGLEVAARLEDRARVVTGHCYSYGEGITFLPLAEVVRELSGGADSPASVLAGADDAEAVAAGLAGVLGAAPSVGEAAFAAVRRLLELAAREPLVVVFEDIHWAEPTMLDLLEYLAEWTRDAPLLLLCLARPELLELRPGWGGGKLNAATMLLGPLSLDACRVLAEGLGLAHRGSLERVVEVSGGNPLFVEQLLAFAAEGWDGLEIPPAIQALLAARLDRLSVAERSAIEAAAVVGVSAAAEDVAMLLEQPVELAAGLLMGLARKELLRPLDGDREFAFRHVLIREAAYAALPKQVRANLHERYFDWLETQPRGTAPGGEEILGYHLERACLERAQLRPPGDHDRDLARRAAVLLANSGNRAFERLDYAAAANLLGRAAALLPACDPARIGALADSGFSLFELSEFERALAVLGHAAAESKDGDPALHWRARAEQERIQIYLDPGRAGVQALRVQAERAIPEVEQVGDDVTLSRLWALITDIDSIGGTIGRGDDGFRAVEHARRSGRRPELARTMQYLGWLVLSGSMPVEEAMRRSRALVEEQQGDPVAQTIGLGSIACLEAELGQFDRARSNMRTAIAAFRDLGHAYWGTQWELYAGGIELLAGDPIRAESHLRTALAGLREARDGWFGPLAAIDLARALVLQGRSPEALAVLDIRGAAADTEATVRAMTAHALIERTSGHPDRAEHLARAAVERAESSDLIWCQGEAWLELGEALAAQLKVGEATDALTEAERRLERKGLTIRLGWVQAARLAIREPRSAAP
jgi:class 3 adenylate cyclase/tetratricopeptide (TPR) repeat protein